MTMLYQVTLTPSPRRRWKSSVKSGCSSWRIHLGEYAKLSPPESVINAKLMKYLCYVWVDTQISIKYTDDTQWWRCRNARNCIYRTAPGARQKMRTAEHHHYKLSRSWQYTASTIFQLPSREGTRQMTKVLAWLSVWCGIYDTRL